MMKRYEDSEGNDCSIHQMVRREPEWAANRILVGEEAQARIRELEEILQDAVDNNRIVERPEWWGRVTAALAGTPRGG